jgi:hypothetical protein
MKHKTLFLRVVSTFMLFLLVSCGTAPPPGPAEKTEGQGSAPDIKIFTYKCQGVRNWIEAFQQQYPDINLAFVPSDYQSMPQIGNLFRDSSFAPVFGFPYTSENAHKLADTRADVLLACDDISLGARLSDIHFFRPFKNFFTQTFGHFDPMIERLAKDTTRREEWMNTALIDLETLPLDTSGLEKLELEIATPGRTLIAPLWPSEQQSFMKAVTAKRKEIADRVAVGQGTPPSFPAPQQVMPLPFPLIEQPAQTVEERVAGRLRDLEAIPLTVDGRQQSVDWITSFERDFSAYNSNDQIIKARWAWILNREKIFKATKDDFLIHLAKLPTGLGAETAHSRLLIETFPLRADETMAVYKEYRAAMLARQKPFFRRTFELGLDKLLSVREWLSDAARKAVHGSGAKELR